MSDLIEKEQAIDASMGKRIVITDLPFQLNGHWGSCSEHLVIHGNGSITDTKGHDIGKCIEEPEIIRCKDCKHNHNCEIQYAAQAGDLFYCGAAERRDG